MQRDNFNQSERVYRHDPENGKHRRLMSEHTNNKSTVNAYCRWLRQMGKAYEVRLHKAGYYLVKSEYGGL